MIDNNINEFGVPKKLFHVLINVDGDVSNYESRLYEATFRDKTPHSIPRYTYSIDYGVSVDVTFEDGKPNLINQQYTLGRIFDSLEDAKQYKAKIDLSVYKKRLKEALSSANYYTSLVSDAEKILDEGKQNEN